MSTTPCTLDEALRPGRARAVVELPATGLVDAAGAMWTAGFRLALVAAHDEDDRFRIVYLFTAGPPDRRVELHVHIDRRQPSVPSLAHLSFPASRFEREMRDLFGIDPSGHPMPRRLVLHNHWPEGWHPMRHDAGPAPAMVDDAAPYPFIDVEGPGVYEIPVGPVHAGLIEPGHFRFWVVGETILKMKARLWFVHKGIERLFEGRAARPGVELAERISGDSAVGHGLAFCLAVEEARGMALPTRAHELRAALLELERLYNHVADIGALCNDVGFGLANARALTLRERLLRLNAEVTGHRLLRGAIVPGGVELARLPRPDELDDIGAQFRDLTDLARSSGIVMDRFTGTAVLGTTHADEIGVLGVVARASGRSLDARISHPFARPRGRVPSRLPGHRRRPGQVPRPLRRGRHVPRLAQRLRRPRRPPGGPRAQPRDEAATAGSGAGIVEGWRGTIVHRVEVDPTGHLRRVKVVDPSFFNWPALSVALADTIVPDFPLANKSFNLSYAGNDL